MVEADLEDLARRPARYWHIDGLPELMLGVFWIVWGAAWLFGQGLPHDWRWNAYWLIVPSALAAGGFIVNRATRSLKERLTFPRTGYVAWNEPSVQTKAALATFVIIAATLLVVVLWRAGGSVDERTPAILGVLLSLSLVAIAIRQGTPHHFVLAGAGVILTLVIAQRTSGWNSFNWLLVSLGAACAVVGTVRLLLFLRAHPRAAEGM